jgi:hypothetical protein
MKSIFLEWIDLPLDVYLSEVPEDRVVAQSNFRSAFTDVFFIRNNEKGRAFVMDWVALAQSGWIHCHGFDQV